MNINHARETCIKALGVKLHNRRVIGRLMASGDIVWKFRKLTPEGIIEAQHIRLSVEAVRAMAAIVERLQESAKPCPRCSTPGPLARCPVCGEWLCGKCKPHPGICLACFDTPDGRAADLAESVHLENRMDQLRADVRNGERYANGERVKDGGI